MRNYPVKENPTGSAVSEILRYKQTNILLLHYKDNWLAELTWCFEYFVGGALPPCKAPKFCPEFQPLCLDNVLAT